MGVKCCDVRYQTIFLTFILFSLSKSAVVKDLIFLMLSPMRSGGHFCFNRYDFNSSSLVSRVFSSEMIIFSLLAKLYGMPFLVRLG